MAQLHPYLVFNGNCEEAFSFYKAIFGGEFSYIGKFKDMPAEEGSDPISAEAGEKIMHVSYSIGSSIIMGSDANPMQGNISFGQNISLSIDAESRAEADKVFNSLAEDGQTIMPLQDTFWGAYFGMCTDKFGIQWMVNYDEPKN